MAADEQLPIAAEAPPPLISVALCTYNGADYLGELLASLQAQSWPRLEIIAVDDASSDHTWDLLQQAASSDSRLQCVRNASTLGLVANFERALSLCRGALIAPCDQDDIWQHDKLAKLHAALGPHTLAYCDSALIDEQGRPLGQRVSDRLRMVEGNDPLPFAFWNCISGHAMLFRRELLGWALPLPNVRFHDWWLAFVAASRGSIVFLPRVLVSYRQHARSQTDLSRRHGRSASAEVRARERVEWLRVLAQYPSAHQPLFERLHALADARQSQWFCPAWVRLLNAHASRLLAINRRESFVRFGLKQFFGMRWRHLGRSAAAAAGA